MRCFLPHIFLFSFSVGRGNTLSAPSRSSSEFVSVELLHAGSPPVVLLAKTTQPLLTLAEMAGFRAPSECRRGNCLSCAARLLPGSSWNYATDPDTFLCDEAREAGFILTCCTYPVGPGLKLQLEQQSEAFQIQFYDRLTAGREAGTAASAKRRSACCIGRGIEPPPPLGTEHLGEGDSQRLPPPCRARCL